MANKTVIPFRISVPFKNGQTKGSVMDFDWFGPTQAISIALPKKRIAVGFGVEFGVMDL